MEAEAKMVNQFIAWVDRHMKSESECDQPGLQANKV